jgi:hypothetical protein
VRHDGSGRGGGWHLAWAKVSNLTTGAVGMFKCNRWVDRRGHDKPHIVSVVLELPPNQAAAAGGLLSAKDRLLLGGSFKAAAAAAARAPLVQDVRMEAEPGGEAPEAGAVAAAPAAGLPGYRVVFHTSRICCGSGTNAKVGAPVWLVGALPVALASSQAAQSFGAGRLDIFEYPALPCLGELQSARVGTDGSGPCLAPPAAGGHTAGHRLGGTSGEGALTEGPGLCVELAQCCPPPANL